MTALAHRGDGSVANIQDTSKFSFIAKSWDEAWNFAEAIANSDLAPKDYRGKPANVLVAIQMGGEVGLSPMQSVQSIAIINGNPSLYGDGMLGLVRGNALCEWIKEERVGTPGTDSDGWTCEAKRVGDPNVISNTFTVADAKAAGLWNKKGPWEQYGATRMTKWRARSWTCRDGFADVLKGLKSAEEVMDIPDETRDAIVNAPNRREAVKAAIAARAPRSVTATVNATPADAATSPAQVRSDPDYATAPAQTLRDFVDEVAIECAVSPDELSAIVRSAGGFKRSLIPGIVEELRQRKPVVKAAAEDDAAAVGELVDEGRDDSVDDFDGGSAHEEELE